MDDKSYLAYVNAKAFCFNHADFNFDARYIFEMELDDTEFLAKYILHVSKRKGLTQTDGFWGNNINSVSIVCGQNGAGKTSFFRLMTNNIGSGLTAMNGEFICYIVYHNGVYVVFTNTTRLEIEQSDAGDIVILTEKEYYKTLKEHNSYKPPFDNRRFWKNIIFFSNHFGTMGIRDDDYIINVSKDVEIGKVINKIETIDKLKKVSLQSIYKYNQNLKLFRYSNDEAFKMMASNCKVSLPNLLKFTINENTDYDAFIDDEKFPNKKWIGKPRYDIYTYADRDYEYEAAINRFSAYLMIDLLKRKIISEGVFQNFSDVLSTSPDKIGLEIALEILNECSNAQIEIWKQCLTFILNKSKNESERFVLNWQLEDEFCCRWNKDDTELIAKLLLLGNEYSFVSFELVGSEVNGHYSSGEESKLLIFLSMYEALKKVEIQHEGNSNNIIILLDEIDAFFHPKYQINIISELLEVISKGFEKYSIQIIIASNTPLELSDIPSSNIIYLQDGKTIKNQNNMETFGSNVCSLMKNQFFINTTMGAFAKKKIDEVIRFLSDNNYTDINKEDAAYIISIIGEPIVKRKLQEMYEERFPFDNTTDEEKVKYYKNRVQELQEKIRNKQKIDDSTLISLEDILQKLSDIVKNVKE